MRVLSITLLIWRVAAHGRIRDVPLWVGLAFTARLGALRLSDGSSGGETVATSPSQSATGTRPSERIPLGPATSHPVGVGQIEAGDIMRSARWEGGSAM
jgi:hypothetical protein